MFIYRHESPAINITVKQTMAKKMLKIPKGVIRDHIITLLIQRHESRAIT